MPPPIARTYVSRETADAAADALRRRRLSADPVRVVGPVGHGDQPAGGHSGGSATEDEALAAVLATGLAPTVAPIYAAGLRKGETLVVVHPLLGRSHAAKSILHGFGPTDTIGPEVSLEAPAAAAVRGDCCAAPLSTALGMPVLLSDPAPLSTYFRWPVLRAQPASSKTLVKIRGQSNDPAPLSKKIGMRVLSDDPSPLSRMLRWPTSSGDSAPLSTRLGWRVLIDDPAPFSRLLGWSVLWRPKRRPPRYVRYL